MQNNFLSNADMMFALAVIICLVIAAYGVTSFIAQKSVRNYKSKNMRVLEVLSLGVDKFIYLVKVGDKFILVSVCGKAIQYLTDINSSEIEDVLSEQATTPKPTNLETVLKDLFLRRSRTEETDETYETDNKVFGNIEKIKDLFTSFHSRNKEDD